MKQNQLYLINTLRQRIKKLEILAHEPQNYKEKCEELEERVETLERELENLKYRFGQ